MEVKDGFTVKVDSTFNTADELVQSMEAYAASEGFAFRVERRNIRRVWIVCKNRDSCSFKVRATHLKNGTWKVHTLTPHDLFCISTSKGCVSEEWVTEIFFDHVKDDRTLKIRQLMHYLKRDFFVEPTYRMVHRAKQAVISKLNGNEDADYSKLENLIETIKIQNTS